MTARQVLRMLDMAEHCARAEPPFVTWREIEPPARSAAPSPAFMFGPSTPALAQQMFGQTATPGLGCYIVEGGGIGPTGIALRDGAVFSLHATNHPPRHVAEILARLQASDLGERFIPGPLVALFGPSHEIYGHTLVDYLPKLWVLQAAGYDLADLRFVVPAKLAPVLLHILHGAGIAPAQCVPYAFWDEIIRTDLLIVPTIPRRFNRVAARFAEASGFWTAPLRNSLARTSIDAKTAPRRVFLSRRKARGTRKLANRDDIEHEATRHGFTIVHPETLSLAEQITLFENARLICGDYGSALHNIVFSAPGTMTCALRGTQADPGFIQTNIADALGQSTGYVFGPTLGDGQAQEFTIDPADFRAALESMAIG